MTGRPAASAVAWPLTIPISAPTQAEAKMRMATARQNGTDEELFTYVSVRKVEQQGLMSQVVSQLVG